MLDLILLTLSLDLLDQRFQHCGLRVDGLLQVLHRLLQGVQLLHHLQCFFADRKAGLHSANHQSSKRTEPSEHAFSRGATLAV